MMYTTLALTLATALVSAADHSIPAGLQAFYNTGKYQQCQNPIGHHDLQDGQTPETQGFKFCQDKPGAVYLVGNNMWADMDVDCDGAQSCPGDGDFQPDTAFDDILKSKNYGIKHLNAKYHPFVVLGTTHAKVDSTTDDGKPPGPIAPLSVVAVVCNGELHYGIFGDTNGDDNDDYVGEASYSLASQICFPGQGLDGANGYTPHDVLYVAFTGPDAQVGPDEAPWTGTDPKAFEAAIKAKGDRLVASVFGSGSPITTAQPTPQPTQPTQPSCDKSQSCSFAGHCYGATCSTDDDCSGSLTCNGGTCGCEGAAPVPVHTAPAAPSCKVATCQWQGHCFGDQCTGNNDCDGNLACNGGACGCASDNKMMMMMKRGTPTTLMTRRVAAAASAAL